MYERGYDKDCATRLMLPDAESYLFLENAKSLFTHKDTETRRHKIKADFAVLQLCAFMSITPFCKGLTNDMLKW